ncbi:hypothetical protein IOC57_25270 [Bacillus sp. SD075]|uniref:hypothetical protein n=1 Tax=Bacillus sp. SD075 TaxID=2781732 RepID=UPI001A9651A3|nr:hypothetical protein [Bacillus sp. SD075]MBO1001020.1 hypothetical protein [Bacillus sp. SD075]
MANANVYRTDEKNTLFDFFYNNTLIVSVTYTVGNESREVEGLISGHHPEVSMISVKHKTEGRDYCVPIRNIEEIVIVGPC